MKAHNIDPTSILFKPRSSEKFLIAELDLLSFELAVYQLKHSIWWNVYGFFLIQRISERNSCENAYDYLKIVWEFNILSSTFLCLNSESEMQMYTFNPYTNNAPNDWTIVESYIQENGRPLTLFRKTFNFYGKRTRVFGSYTIFISERRSLHIFWIFLMK